VALNSSADLGGLIRDFLTDLAHANRSVHTRRAYATDLAQFCGHYQQDLAHRE